MWEEIMKHNKKLLVFSALALLSLTSCEIDLSALNFGSGTPSDLISIVDSENSTPTSVEEATSEEQVSVTKPSVEQITCTVQSTSTKPTSTSEATSNVSVNSISLSAFEKTLKLNKTFALTPVVAPINATNKNVSWSSSDNSIASVDANGVVTAKKEGKAVITVITEDENYKATCNINVVEDDGLADYTIMIYMCGADLESESSFATSNITEILSVKNMPENVNIIIETGGAKSWDSTYGISANYLQRWHVSNNQLVKDENVKKVSMGLSSTFQSFMEWGLTSYPATQTGVVFWNHGGAMQGCCYDENFNSDSLTNEEVSTALKNAFTKVGRTEKLSWVGYDCCLMQVADIADFNSEYFEYMVASQESEPGEGWDYDNWLDNLYTNTSIEAPELLQEIADTFVAKCAASYNSYGGQYRGYNDATMSVLDLSKMPLYRLAWEYMSLNLSKVITSSSAWTTFKNLVKKCQQFGYDDSYGYTFDVYDLGDFIAAMKANLKYSTTGVELVEEAFQDLLVYNIYGKNSADASGLCFFAAICGYSSKDDYNSTQTNFSNWLKLNETYGSWYSNSGSGGSGGWDWGDWDW